MNQQLLLKQGVTAATNSHYLASLNKRLLTLTITDFQSVYVAHAPYKCDIQVPV